MIDCIKHDNINYVELRKKVKILNKKAIGFMDSGVGGLTIAKVAMQKLPKENIIYFGDEARLPYGEKTPEQIKSYALQISKFLLCKNIKMLVIACNTATALALPFLKEQLSIPVIGVINPGSLAAVKATNNNHVGVIATNGTVKSGKYENEIKQVNENVYVVSLGCPSFVTMVENQGYKESSNQSDVDKVLAKIKSNNIDTLVMGCTHFPIMRSMIQQSMGDKVQLIDPGIETIKQVDSMLKENNIYNDESTPHYDFYTTGDVNQFKAIANEWLNQDVNVKHIDVKELEDY